MSDELKNEDLQSLAKQQIRLMKQLTRITAFQAIFVVTFVCVLLVGMLGGGLG